MTTDDDGGFELTDEELEGIVDRLVGQCVRSLDDELADLDPQVDQTVLSQACLDRIDARLFWCDSCGWCCSAEELNNETDEDLCAECKPDDED